MIPLNRRSPAAAGSSESTRHFRMILEAFKSWCRTCLRSWILVKLSIASLFTSIPLPFEVRSTYCVSSLAFGSVSPFVSVPFPACTRAHDAPVFSQKHRLESNRSDSFTHCALFVKEQGWSPCALRQVKRHRQPPNNATYQIFSISSIPEFRKCTFYLHTNKTCGETSTVSGIPAKDRPHAPSEPSYTVREAHKSSLSDQYRKQSVEMEV